MDTYPAGHNHGPEPGIDRTHPLGVVRRFFSAVCMTMVAFMCLATPRKEVGQRCDRDANEMLKS